MIKEKKGSLEESLVPKEGQTWSNLMAKPMTTKELAEAWRRCIERLRDMPMCYQPTPVIMSRKDAQALLRIERCWRWRKWRGDYEGMSENHR